MRFCTKCGAQLLDEAVICTKCGCMVEGMRRPVPRAPQQVRDGLLDVTEKRPSTLLVVFDFLFAIFAVLTLFWVAIAFAENYLSANISTKGYNYSISGHIRFEEDYMSVAIVGAIASLACALTSFIMTMVEKQRIERLFSAIVKLCAGLFLTFATIYFVA